MSLLRRVAGHLPSGIKTMAKDSVWTLGLEMSLLISVTASFVLLGRELGTEGYGEYIGLFAITTPLSAIGSASMLAAMQYMFAEERPVERVMSIFLTTTVLGGLVASVAAVILASATLPSLSLVTIVSMAVGEIILVPIGRVVGAGVRALHGVPAAVRVQLAFLVLRFVVLVGLFGLDSLSVERLSIGWLVANLAIVSVLLVVTLPANNYPSVVHASSGP